MKTLFSIILVIVLVWIGSRSAIYLLPGDPAEFLYHDSLVSVPIDTLRANLDLPKGILQRIFSFPKSFSLITHQSALLLTKNALIKTLILCSFTLFFTMIFTFFLLLGAHLHPNLKRSINLLCTFFSSLPLYLSGPLALLIFSIQFHFFPLANHPLLPALTLSLSLSSFWFRTLFYQIETYRPYSAEAGARARGIDEISIFIFYLFYPCLGKMMGFVGSQMGVLLNGSILVEIIFNWNGLGRMMTEAVLSRDYPVIEMGLLTTTLLTLLCQQFGFALQRKMEPRLK